MTIDVFDWDPLRDASGEYDKIGTMALAISEELDGNIRSDNWCTIWSEHPGDGRMRACRIHLVVAMHDSDLPTCLMRAGDPLAALAQSYLKPKPKPSMPWDSSPVNAVDGSLRPVTLLGVDSYADYDAQRVNIL